MSSHPYPARRGREVVAVSGWRLGMQTRRLGQHVVLSLPQDSATWGQTRSEFRTKSDPVASTPRIQLQFLNLGTGQAE